MNEVRTTSPADLKAFLLKHLEAVEAVASATLTPDRMVRLVCAAASRDPKLASCTPVSILRSLAQSASMGLEPFDGRNEAHLVPRWNKRANNGRGGMEATLLVGYPGLIRIATETGKVLNIEARVVYEKDTFEVEYGMAPRLTHKPAWDKDRGKIIAVYAVAFMPDGRTTFEVMPNHEVEDIRDRSKDKDGFSPWQTDYAEMARKTAVRRLCKYLPKSQALAHALEVQAKAEAGDYLEAEDPPARPGDAPITGTVQPTLNGDGEQVYEWSAEDKAAFFDACDTLLDTAIKAGETETDAGYRIRFYQDQKAAGESPEKVLNRMAASVEKLQKKINTKEVAP